MEYNKYLKKEKDAMLNIACEKEIMEVVSYYTENKLITASVFNKLLKKVQKKDNTKLVKLLTDYGKKNISNI